MQAYETTHQAGDALSMHRHGRGYMALVLDGAYEERSVDGCYMFGAGTLVYHPPFHAHSNQFHSGDVRVLNIELAGTELGFATYATSTTSEVHAIERLMRERPGNIVGLAQEIFRIRDESRAQQPRWLEGLATALSDGEDGTTVKALAARFGITPEYASRRFATAFGVGPSVFRREQQLRRALLAFRDGASLSSAAALAGFSDQSHMGRAFKAALGETPGTIKSEFERDRAF